jgi:hypothetical protein
MSDEMVAAGTSHLCRSCGAPLSTTFVDLGGSPLANAYLSAAELDQPERFYPLRVFVCGSCFLVQLPRAVAPEEIFVDYAYFSSFSESWVEHARQYVGQMIDRFGFDATSKVIEIASNDGYLLRSFVERPSSASSRPPTSRLRRSKPASRHSSSSSASSWLGG